MASRREYVSPDGTLRFLMLTDDDGDVSLGFDRFAWHTHPECLAVGGVSEAEAVERFIQDLLQNRTVIVISRVRGHVQDVWITDDPAAEFRYLEEGESVELRYWSGEKWIAA